MTSKHLAICIAAATILFIAACSESTTLQSEVDSLRKDVVSVENRLRTTADNLANAEIRIQANTDRNSTTTALLETHQSQIDVLREEKTSILERIDESENQIDSLWETVSSIEESLVSQRNADRLVTYQEATVEEREAFIEALKCIPGGPNLENATDATIEMLWGDGLDREQIQGLMMVAKIGCAVTEPPPHPPFR